VRAGLNFKRFFSLAIEAGEFPPMDWRLSAQVDAPTILLKDNN
jgi:hypothetical protein